MTRAPAKYIGNGAPATFEMATLATGGITLISPERPNMEATPDISHGAPNIGKSSRMTALNLFMVDFDAFDDALICLSLATGSLMSVARLTRIMLAWLLAVSSPASRRLTGMAPTIDFSGSSLLSLRYLRMAPATVPMTTSFRVTPKCLAMCLVSASEMVRPAKVRWLVIDTLKGVRGANSLNFFGAVVSDFSAAFSSDLARPPMARAKAGAILKSFTYCCAVLRNAALASSAMPSA